MRLLDMIREARAKPANPGADMIEGLILAAISLFMLGLLVGLVIAK